MPNIFEQLHEARYQEALHQADFDVDGMMANVLPGVRQQILEKFSRVQDRDLREAALKFGERGESATPAAICATFITQKLIYKVLIAATIQSHNEGDLRGFVFWHDLTEGVIPPIGGILTANRALQGERPDELDLEAISFYERTSGRVLDLVETVETYLGLQSSARYTANLLHQDPTGLSVIDYYVDLIHQEARKPSVPIVPEYIIAGSWLARDVYGGVYPFAENLSQPLK